LIEKSLTLLTFSTKDSEGIFSKGLHLSSFQELYTNEKALLTQYLSESRICAIIAFLFEPILQ